MPKTLFGLLQDEPRTTSWVDDDAFERESSPPMPSMPPPPPPAVDPLEDPGWDASDPDLDSLSAFAPAQDEPYAVALFDYCTDHPEDLSFAVSTMV